MIALHQTLPIDALVPEFLEAVSRNPVTIITAAPGAGKTTRLPLALLDHPTAAAGKILMLEPRRLAAQRAAGYMASLLGEEVGGTVGYRIRGASCVSASTSVEVVTEGILTRMIQDAPDLPSAGILIFDEFHERSIHADLGLALALDVQANLRPDLRIVIMSATLDGVGLGRILPEATTLSCPGRQYPIETVYLAFTPTGPFEITLRQAVIRALNETEGDILAFLPGRRELRRVRDALLDSRLPSGVHVHLLHGEADPQAQRAALSPAPHGERKIILSTSVAETSITLDGVRVVIDSGLSRIPRFDPRRGMTGLVTVPVSLATADQRRGRAGRQAAGVCYRLWTEDEHRKLDAYPIPEILAADLAPLALELARWGSAEASDLKMIDPPPPHNLAQARRLLADLGVLDAGGRISQHGLAMAALPVHPRLAHMMLSAQPLGLASDACTVAALLDGPPLFPESRSSDIDLASAIHTLGDQRGGDRTSRLRIRSEADRLRRLLGIGSLSPSFEHPGLLLALAYPDRIARRRGEAGRRYLLVNGTGATLPDWSLLARHEFLAVGAVDSAGVEARILMAAPVAPDEIRRIAEAQLQTIDEVYWDSREAAVVARRATRLGAILLSEQNAPPGGDAVRKAMIQGVRELGLEILPWNASTASLRLRSEWIRRNHLAGSDWPDLSTDTLQGSLDRWLGPFLTGITKRDHLARLDLTRILLALLSPRQHAMLETLAPTHLPTPAGRRIALQYGDGPQPAMPVRLQEMFGQTASPTVGGGRINVVLHLLSPAGRPLAVTSDLRSFWTNAYPEVRKQMRGRYPKHRWPENPMEEKPGRA